MSVPALEVADVAKSYGSLSVLGSVSLAVAAGEAVGAEQIEGQAHRCNRQQSP